MKKIVITGGNFINKGAQSMLFSLVDGIKKKYTDSEIVMIDIFPSLKKEDKEIYNFRILNFHIRSILRMTFPVLKIILKPKPISDKETEILSSFKQADLVLDISGYGVSSHNQNPLWTYATIYPIILAKKFQVPFIFLPQSIGPFDFKGWKALVIWPLIKKLLKYPKTIFYREPECKQHLQKIRSEGIIESLDIVLQSANIDPKNIYKKKYSLSIIAAEIKQNSIVIIPNKQLTRFKSQEDIVSLFSTITNTLTDRNKEVVILRHSSDDKQLCSNIFEKTNKSKVKLINQDLSPYHIEQIIDKSSFVISSRYHGLIHALKSKKPCIVIGWANKYKHVMEYFALKDYYFEINKFTDEDLNTSIETLSDSTKDVELKIINKLNEIRYLNIYEYL